MKRKLALLLVMVLMLNMCIAVSASTIGSNVVPYTMIDLTGLYNRDAFAYKSEAGNLTASTSLTIATDSTAAVMYADNDSLGLLGNTSYNAATGRYTYQGIEYQMGYIGADEERSITANIIHSSNMDIPINGKYKNLSILGNNPSPNKSSITISVYYQGEATPVVDQNVTYFGSFRSVADVGGNCPGETSIGTIAAACKQSTFGVKEYEGYGYLYTIETDPTKVVSKINVARGYVAGYESPFNIFAITGIGYSLAEVETEIDGLSDPYNASDTALIQSIRTQINALLAIGVEISDFDAVKYAKFTDLERQLGNAVVKNKMFDLSYTRDVFVTNYYRSSNDGYIVNMLTSNAAMLEETLQALPNFNAGVLTFNNVGYKFGPLGTVDIPNTANNAIHSGNGNPIVINVPNELYDNVSFIANGAGTNDVAKSAVVTYSYTDGTTSVDQNITRILSYRLDTLPTTYNTNENFVARVGAIRYGGDYKGNLFSYTGTPDSTKMLKSISINSADCVVYAMTGQVKSTNDTITLIESMISALPNVYASDQDSNIKKVRAYINHALENNTILSDFDQTLYGKFVGLEREMEFKSVKYINVPLNYNKDVFIYFGEDMSVATGQMYATSSGYDVALPINRLELLSTYLNGVITVDGVPHQLGPIGTKTAKSTVPNALSIPRYGSVTIDVPSDNYNKINFIANQNQSEATTPVAINVYYVGEATPVTSEVNRISSVRTTYTLASYEKFIGQIGATRGDNSTTYYTYPGYIYEYSITTDPTKVVDRITFANGGTGSEIFIFAMTGVAISLDQKVATVESKINALSETATTEEISAIRSEIDGLMGLGVLASDFDTTLYNKFILLENPNLSSIYIDSISLFDGVGTPIDSIVDAKGQTITVKMNVANAVSVTDISYFESVIGLFSQNSMSQARIGDMNCIAENNNYEIEVQIDVPEDADSTWYIKGFVFDSLNTLMPLSETNVFPNN